MADLIERDALKKHVCDMCDDGQRECKGDESCAILCWINDMPTTNHWVSCSDRLPEIDIDVIVYYPYWDDKPIQVAHLNYDKLTFELSDGEFYFPTSGVTHWMSLPKPPEIGDANG